MKQKEEGDSRLADMHLVPGERFVRLLVSSVSEVAEVLSESESGVESLSDDRRLGGDRLNLLDRRRAVVGLVDRLGRQLLLLQLNNGDEERATRRSSTQGKEKRTETEGRGKRKNGEEHQHPGRVSAHLLPPPLPLSFRPLSWCRCCC